MEVSALKHPGIQGLRGPTPLLRLQSDERLVALTRRGNQSAFETLVSRYETRLLAFCRHMLGSREDAEDVLQEVFAAAFNAMLADERAINVRPWLYRIARNRSLNHLRRHQAIGVDSMDVHLAENGTTTADKAHRREDFRLLMADVQELAETQKTALLLREIDALSYEQIAEAMETTVPSVKSLLVRARVALAEAGEARKLTCAEVRLELGEVAEGLKRTTAPVRRHVRGCDRCQTFRKQLRQTNRALAAMLPVGPLLILKKVLLAHLGTTASAGGAGAGAAGAGAGATAAAGTAAAGSGISAGTLSAGIGAVATKTAAGIAAAALVTAGAVEVDQARRAPARQPVAPAHTARVVPAAPVVRPAGPVVRQPTTAGAPAATTTAAAAAERKAAGAALAAKTAAAKADAKAKPAAGAPATGGQAAPTTQEESDTTVVQAPDAAGSGGVSAPQPQPQPPAASGGQPAPAAQPAPRDQSPPPSDQAQATGDQSSGQTPPVQDAPPVDAVPADGGAATGDAQATTP